MDCDCWLMEDAGLYIRFLCVLCAVHHKDTKHTKETTVLVGLRPKPGKRWLVLDHYEIPFLVFTFVSFVSLW